MPAKRTIDVSFHSKSLDKDCSYTVYLPKNYEPTRTAFPTLYLLHDKNGKAKDFIKLGKITTILDKLIKKRLVSPMVLVMPQDCSEFESCGYLNWADGSGDFEDYISKDIIEHAESNFRLLLRRSARGVLGIGVGGHGAMNLTLRNTDMFGSVSAHSAIYSEEAFRKLFNKGFATRMIGAKGSSRARSNSPERNAGRFRRLAYPPMIKFDCGEKDSYLEDTKKMHRALNKFGAEHEFTTYPGGHDWKYWNARFEDALLFHGETFALEDI